MPFDCSVWLRVATLWLLAEFSLGAQVVVERKTRLRQMEATEKEELSRKHARFSKLPYREQERLRRLHASLEASPRAERLRQVMLRYHEWLKALPSGQRAELLSLPRAERLDEIQRIVNRQERERFGILAATKLLPSDHDAILAWLNNLIGEHEREFAQRLPVNVRRRMANMSDAERRRALMFNIRRRMGNGRSPIELIPLDEADIQRLASRLSADAARTLNEVQGEGPRQDLLRGWIAAATLSRRPPQVNQAELRTFYENLDPETKEHLENLPRDRRRSELRQLFMKRRFEERRRPFRRRPRGQSGLRSE